MLQNHILYEVAKYYDIKAVNDKLKKKVSGLENYGMKILLRFKEKALVYIEPRFAGR
jgi:predicted DNA-binding protein YlxM (UPF0122 family)